MGTTEKGGADGGLAQVGPRYGVKDYLRVIQESWKHADAGMLWADPAEAGLAMRLKGRRLVEHVVHAMETGPLSTSFMAVDAPVGGRRLGKSSTTLSAVIGHPSLFGEPQEGDEPRVRHVSLALMGLAMRIEDDRVVGTLNAPLIALTGHALERVYEREGVHTGGMAAEMREMTTALTHRIAAAMESDVVIEGCGDDPDDEDTDAAYEGRPADAIHPKISDVTLVPCKGGLMVVETITTVSISDTSPVVRLETRRSGTWSRASPSLGERVSETRHKGHRVFVSTVRLCRTYLSADMLRPEQERYRDLFLDAMGQVDGAGAARRLFGSDDVHRTADATRVDMPHAESMRGLLPRCVRPPTRPGGLWLVY